MAIMNAPTKFVSDMRKSMPTNVQKLLKVKSVLLMAIVNAPTKFVSDMRKFMTTNIQKLLNNS